MPVNARRPLLAVVAGAAGAGMTAFRSPFGPFGRLHPDLGPPTDPERIADDLRRGRSCSVDLTLADPGDLELVAHVLDAGFRVAVWFVGTADADADARHRASARGLAAIAGRVESLGVFEYSRPVFRFGLRASRGRVTDRRGIAWIDDLAARLPLLPLFPPDAPWEDPDVPLGDASHDVLPPERFGPEYHEAADVPSRHRGPGSRTVAGLLLGSCAGWRVKPTSAEFYAACRAASPTRRQLAVVGVLVTEGSWLEWMNASYEGAFTWRQLARIMRRLGPWPITPVRWINSMRKPSRGEPHAAGRCGSVVAERPAGRSAAPVS